MKPSVQFKLYPRWRLRKVKALFVAEAPPWLKKGEAPRYFYNHKVYNGMRRMLLAQLGIGDYGERGLEEFKDRGYLLSDTVKCRLFTKDGVPEPVAERCVTNFLSDEILLLNPEKIFLLGGTALRGMVHSLMEGGHFREAERLKRFRQVTKHCGETIEVDGSMVIVYVFPNTRRDNMAAMHRLPLPMLLEDS
ncbi:MAG TPA: uracil-DNA glycosylase family protein [Candidatus Bathyarchaeia archaeon]|nr:uracil-DNA glycosylase family protein [Candidatus Bathyarchaeia archaeon]